MKMNKNKTEKEKAQERILYPSAKKLMNKGKEARIQYIKDGFFVNYDFANYVYQEILDLLEQPIRPRMEGLLIHSPTNNGKTTLIKRFILEYLPKIGELVYVETPERATLKEFYAEILNVMGYPVKVSRSTGDLRRKILLGLQNKKVKILFVDEIHNLLDSRRDHKTDILNGLKSLNNKAQIPIVLVGINTAEDILSLDEQVADRYPPLEIPLWQKDKIYLDLLATFEANLPLRKQSEIYSPKISNYIHELSDGKIGRIATIIRKASIKAIRDDTEHITNNLLKSIPFRWKKPKRQTQF